MKRGLLPRPLPSEAPSVYSPLFLHISHLDLSSWRISLHLSPLHYNSTVSLVTSQSSLHFNSTVSLMTQPPCDRFPGPAIIKAKECVHMVDEVPLTAGLQFERCRSPPP